MTQTARVYGGSLYELAAEETLTDTIREQMLAVKDLFQENPDYLALLCEPSIAKDERIGLIETAFGNRAERYLVSFLKLLCEKGILREYAGCCEEYTRRYNADHNIAEAVVTSAVALTDAQTEALKEKLEKKSGKTVVLTQKIDPAVVAGLRVELEGKQLDGTVQGRMSGISRKLADVVI
ncbi:MAG: ATP synthase F1 subunit delta [Lachnospiraceae bacterium]|nr:ATP synthase F1 subunit delta [Lachnospiraceae bacterium]